MSTYCRSGVVLSTVHILIHLIFRTNPVTCILRLSPFYRKGIRKGRDQEVKKLAKGHIAKRGSQD